MTESFEPVVFAGVDWATEKHDACVVDGNGRVRAAPWTAAPAAPGTPATPAIPATPPKPPIPAARPPAAPKSLKSQKSQKSLKTGKSGKSGKSKKSSKSGGGDSDANAKIPRGVNSDFDLWSRGPDGETGASLSDSASKDDILRADNGMFVGPVARY